MTKTQAPRLFDWWQLPSGKLISIRKITGVSRPELTVRYINDDGAMEPGEFFISMAFLAAHGKRIAVTQ